MTDFTVYLIRSTIDTLSEALPFLLVILFYAVTILQLPMDTVVEMFGMLGVITLGMNLILSEGN
ncbi:MAG: hypothetical protein KJ914_17950 [Gammaproteobacteria bacterium]|nr:hypothetical protein [Gammaproteobacteria bacterium]MBU1724241.1 hypothetical protein [Gammaproteobacteria bacterium]MBU2006331.1 hypothetical protein [Gammaproteobacteria bacterium]